MRSRASLLALLLGALSASGAAAEACRGTDPRKPVRDCPPSRRLEPYDPSAARAGRQPGFVDLGNGTEVRIGGRTRLDYDIRR